MDEIAKILFSFITNIVLGMTIAAQIYCVCIALSNKSKFSTGMLVAGITVFVLIAIGINYTIWVLI